MPDDLTARIEEEIATYADLYGRKEAERLRPHIAKGIRENRPPNIKMSETQRRAIDARRAERAEIARVFAGWTRDLIASERAAGVLAGRGDDPGVLTPEEEARAVSILLGEEQDAFEGLSKEDREAAIRLAEGI